jgi:hypothetical protein
MSSTASHPARASSRSTRRSARTQPRPLTRTRIRSRRTDLVCPEQQTIARYTDCSGRAREIVTRAGCAGSVLVFDRDAATQADRRLVAHLAADEPQENAAVASQDYLSKVRRERYLCRSLLPADLTSPPFADLSAGCDGRPQPAEGDVIDGQGCRYELTRRDTGMSIPELRWCRLASGGERPVRATASVRDVIGRVQDYEPVRALTRRALGRHEADQSVSVTALRGELSRIQDSPIVLNRGLRDAVLGVVEQQGLSMSEIAIRCGRVKRDRAGNESGETSWLARRLGLLAEGGRQTPTPWIHSDVLALIARDGLGISPREVELD